MAGSKRRTWPLFLKVLEAFQMFDSCPECFKLLNLIPQLIFQTFPRGPDLKKRGQYRDARKAKTNVSFTSSRKRTQFLPQFSFSTKPSRSSKTNLSSSLARTNFSLRESEEFIRWVKSESSVLKVFLD